MLTILSRRDALRAGALGLTAVAGVPPRAGLRRPRPTAGGEVFTVPKLPYDFDALEPHIDAKTMEIHHDKHHAAYVKNLNNALKDHRHDYQYGKPIGEILIADMNAIPEAIRTAPSATTAAATPITPSSGP